MTPFRLIWDVAQMMIFFSQQAMVLLWRAMYHVSHRLFMETYLFVRHSSLFGLLKRFWRVFCLGSVQRIPIRSLKYSYRPYYRDGFWLVLLMIIATGYTAEKFYTGGIHKLVGQFRVSSSAKIVAGLPNFSRVGTAQAGDQALHKVNFLLRPKSSFYQQWQRLDLQVEDIVQISGALEEVINQNSSSSGEKYFPMDVELRTNDASEGFYRLEKMQIALAEDVSLILTPERDVLGRITLKPNLVIEASSQRERFVLQGTVQELLNTENLKGEDNASIKPNALDIPDYIEKMLLFLDRVNQASGGLRPSDYISAVFRSANEDVDHQLLYLYLDNGFNAQEYLYFRESLDEKGYLYDKEGFAHVLSGWGDPLLIGKISSSFGLRVHPIKKYTLLHRGIDYTAPLGTPIRATQDGVVLQKRFDRNGYGKYIKLQHQNGFETLYAHLQDYHPAVRLGYPVKKGEIIGFLGNTGLSTGPHLHYEVFFNGEQINPVLVQKPELRILSRAKRKKLQGLFRERRAQMARLVSG